ncbi:MAG: glutathione S-transferase N-terminal domain-containing protein [Alphaproteobacteria bacterium]|nr:glutathione S-transferase N-terminal domain-containing protein [Alphaproteobacteria bacterium]
MPLLRALDILTTYAGSALRLGRGMGAAPLGPRPEQPLVLYEFEACPFCRRVREAVTALDLEVLIRPCPKGGPRFREALRAKGGRVQLPFLDDPNTGRALYESVDIVRYMYQTYGAGAPPWDLALPPLLNGLALASWVRPLRGLRYRGAPARAPAEPLVLYGMEASPYTRLAREALCELELPYLLRATPISMSTTQGLWHVARKLTGRARGAPGEPALMPGSARWRELEQRGGKGMVPYLIDPNTGVEMYESADIVRYLGERYGRA